MGLLDQPQSVKLANDALIDALSRIFHHPSFDASLCTNEHDAVMYTIKGMDGHTRHGTFTVFPNEDGTYFGTAIGVRDGAVYSKVISGNLTDIEHEIQPMIKHIIS